jgi:hypothetical protein
MLGETVRMGKALDFCGYNSRPQTGLLHPMESKTVASRQRKVPVRRGFLCEEPGGTSSFAGVLSASLSSVARDALCWRVWWCGATL